MDSHFSFELVDSTCPKPRHARHLADAKALGKFVARTCDLLGLRSRTAKASAHDARSGCEMPIAFDLSFDGTEAGVHALSDHAALELGEGSRHVEE